MRALTLVPLYFHWHYSRAIRHIFGISKNLVIFLWDFFSISLLIRTLFYSWKRDYIDKDNPDSTTWYERLIFNVVLRCIGAGIRTVFIVLGVIGIVAIVLISTLVVIAWLALPVILVVLVILGGVFIFSAL